MNRQLFIAVIALMACGCASAAARPEARKATPTPRTSCMPPSEKPAVSAAAPSQAMLDTLGALKRPAQPGDQPPATALENAYGMDGLMLSAARQIREGTWLLPVENLAKFRRMPERCLKPLPAKQRRAIRRAEQQLAKRPPEEGIAIISGDPPVLGQRAALTGIRDGQAFQIDGCSGPLRDKLGIRGIVADDVTKVTVIAGDGAITEALPDHNTFALELVRPTRASALPSHISYQTATGPTDVKLRATPGLTQSCSPPDRSGNGQRREPPTPLNSPAGAKIELQSSRWEAEDTGPLLVAASYTRPAGRCMIVDTETNLKRGRHSYRFCVDDAGLKRARYLAEAARLPDGNIILAGFVDREQASSITMEHSTIASGARRIATAKPSGAFFLVTKGPRKRAGTYDIHVALRGKPVRYAGRRTITLPAKPD